MKVNLAAAKKLIKKYRNKKGVLIPLLQEIQAAYGYVPGSAIDLVSKELSIYPVDIYGILTFYVMGGKELLDYMTDTLGAREGKPTKDGMFSVERVACLGCCGMAPAVVIDHDFYGRCTIRTMKELVKKYRTKK